jgi:hypothetical protein
VSYILSTDHRRDTNKWSCPDSSAVLGTKDATTNSDTNWFTERGVTMYHWINTATVEVCWRWISKKTGIFWYLCLSFPIQWSV